MTKNDTAMFRPSDIVLAISLLTRLPAPARDHSRSAAAAWAYPLVGLLVGGIAGAVGLLAVWCDLPTPLTALLCIAVLAIVTGAMHEDGLADSADGLWGGWTREARLEIMKDSHIGTYGVIALILAVAARWVALWLLFEIGTGSALCALLTGAVVSRAAMPTLMATLPHARATGLSHGVGSVPQPAAATAWAIAAGLGLILSGGAAFWAALWAGAVTLILARIARRKIGGQTGDILGAAQQVTEIAVLFSLLA